MSMTDGERKHLVIDKDMLNNENCKPKMSNCKPFISVACMEQTLDSRLGEVVNLVMLEVEL